MKTLKNLALTSVAVLFTAWSLPALAADTELQLVIKNNQFQPAEIKAPAGQKLRIVVHNQDSTPEEFESHSLKREKIIPGGAKATILLGPLKPGRYAFFGEFNPNSAKGTLVIE
jgi:plastocyanin